MKTNRREKPPKKKTSKKKTLGEGDCLRRWEFNAEKQTVGVERK